MIADSVEGAPQDASKPIILIVEDEVLLRMLYAEELEAHVFHVIQAANADEALSVLQTSTPVELARPQDLAGLEDRRGLGASG